MTEKIVKRVGAATEGPEGLGLVRAVRVRVKGKMSGLVEMYATCCACDHQVLSAGARAAPCIRRAP